MSRTTSKTTSKIIGILDLHPNGFGFVISKNPDQPDVFIPPSGLAGAMDDDQVEIEIYKNPERKKPEGRVLKIIERARSQVVGVLKKSSSGLGVTTHGSAAPISVKIHPAKTLQAQPGQLVLVKLTQFPESTKSRNQPFEGEITQILGDPEEPFAEVEVTIAKHQLPQGFSEKTLKEVAGFKDNISDLNEKDRRDLREFPIVTIDGENARDFDDGIFVEKNRTGFKIYIAIADVSHFVKPHTHLDQEAYQRATSVYFPYRCIPMLPEALSNNLCSLIPHQDRLAFVAELEYDRKGSRIKSDFYKAIIRNHARLTYTQVSKMMIDEDKTLRDHYASVVPALEVAFDLFRLLRKKRIARGSIDFDLPEPEIVLDMEEGIATSIVKAPRTPSHMLIEEFMIAANEAVAEFVESQGLPMVYRIHETPNPEKLEDFKILAQNLGHGLPEVENLAPKDLANLIHEVKGKPHERLINTLLLRSLKQAVYAPKNTGHFGLALTHYTHFTSPIRRYPDLIVHRLLQEALRLKEKKAKKKKSEIFETLLEMSEHCSKRERIAMKAEWEVRDLHVVLFMKDKIGLEFDGIISGVTKFGFFVELLEYFVEGLVHIKNLTQDHYQFDEKHHELLGNRTKKRFRIGDSVRIQVAKADVTLRRLDFVLVGEEKMKR